MKQSFTLLLLGLLLMGCKGKKEAQEIQVQQQEKVNHLKAFAKAYGYVDTLD